MCRGDTVFVDRGDGGGLRGKVEVADFAGNAVSGGVVDAGDELTALGLGDAG